MRALKMALKQVFKKKISNQNIIPLKTNSIMLQANSAPEAQMSINAISRLLP